MTVLTALLLTLGRIGLGVVAAIAVVALVLAASRRAEDLGADEMRRSRPLD